MKNRGLSLLEILVSTILLALVVAALANIFIATKRLVMHTRSRAAAAELSRSYMDSLQMEISQLNWGVTTPSGNCLRMFAGRNTATWTDTTTNTLYTPDYDANQDASIDIDDMDIKPNPPNPPTDMICRVSLRIDWDERTE